MTERPLPVTVGGVDVELGRIARFRSLYKPGTPEAFRTRDMRRADELLDRRLELVRRDTPEGSSADA